MTRFSYPDIQVFKLSWTRKRSVNWCKNTQMVKMQPTINKLTALARPTFFHRPDPSGDLAPAKGLDIHQLRQTRLEMRLQNAAEKSAQEAVAYVESMHGATGPVTCSTPALQRIYDLGMRVGKLLTTCQKQIYLVMDVWLLSGSLGLMATWLCLKLGFDGSWMCAAGKYIGSDDMPSTLVRSKNDIQEDTPRKDLDVGRMSDLDSDDDDSNDDHSIQKPVALAVKKSGVEKRMTSDGDSDIEGDDGRGDITQMDHGTQANKKRQLGRFDFDTLEEWTAYKEQVHMPKAAFLFGVKAGDRRGKMAGMRNSTEDFDDDEDT
ncbi:hypothetical protein BSLG_005937 [Batrachochytrium salamandrivorans]|nr:hypothetical protein BSLG_005937 [Batrachochytrium salamandrivorans]